MNILVVDDEEDILDALDTYLAMKGHEVTTCQSSEEALELVDTCSYEVVLLDINMPAMDGLALLKKVLERDSYLEAIMITGYNSIDKVIDAREDGATEYLLKPLEMEEVEEVISDAERRINRWQNAMEKALERKKNMK